MESAGDWEYRLRRAERHRRAVFERRRRFQDALRRRRSHEAAMRRAVAALAWLSDGASEGGAAVPFAEEAEAAAAAFAEAAAVAEEAAGVAGPAVAPAASEEAAAAPAASAGAAATPAAAAAAATATTSSLSWRHECAAAAEGAEAELRRAGEVHPPGLIFLQRIVQVEGCRFSRGIEHIIYMDESNKIQRQLIIGPLELLFLEDHMKISSIHIGILTYRPTEKIALNPATSSTKELKKTQRLRSKDALNPSTSSTEELKKTQRVEIKRRWSMSSSLVAVSNTQLQVLPAR
ncbi:hypothetical protein ACP70R_033327 [Stipagrostis hirtigluma subsp. patula]